MNEVYIKRCQCRDCTEHRAGCHSEECAAWAEWHAWQQERKERISKERRLEHALNAIGIRKTKSRRRVAKMLRDQNHQEQKGGNT